ncbi:hypothetical protein [Cupriavidus pampae]|uniref:Oligosaccharide repeat unit polymerase n=1 Tax=Cupriavidus pampae TaxID=659251 RepID=A0ABN7ZCE1_9BURK|nr:hypothetical protein [Cupriavidus pampae]CAG9182002.1 hypothetical protein LMG32289_05010 [Cupriavidus pampae]
MRLSPSFIWDMVLAAALLLMVGYCHAISSVHSPMLLVSTLLLTITVIVHWCLHTRERESSLADASVLLFEMLFLVVAPAVQRVYFDLQMVNTATIQEGYAIATNLLCTLFIMVYVATRQASLRRAYHSPRPLPPPGGERILRLTVPKGMVLAGVAAVAAVLSLQSIDMRVQEELIDATPQYLLQQKYFCFLPIPALMMLICVKGRSLLRQPFWLLLAVLLFGCVLVAQNPLIEKRNAIGPVYLTLLLLAVPWFSRTPRRQATTLLLLTGVFFPLASIFTHVNMDAWDIAEILDPWMYFSHFLDLHYDAWSNIHTVLEMVNRDGLRYGEQILGSLLFFVPHTLWEAKPHATGIDIGQFLMAYYKLDFDNLSSPLIAEGYIDFSVFGVVFVAIALALITRFLDRLIHAGGPVGKPAGIYFSIYLIFVLRGALMVAVAYGSGAAMAFMTISWFVTRRRRRVQRAVPRTAPASSGSPVTPIRRAAPPRRA